MDRLTTLQLFVRIVERGGFGPAAADVGVSRSVATTAMQALERRLGTRLLHRTTRRLRTTAEGETYYRRCTAILADLEDADQRAAGAVAGLLRVDVAGSLARLLLLPALPAFQAAYPALTVHLSEGERFVELIREGVDCVIRAGELADNAMIARRLGAMQEVTCASPAYLASHGTPMSPDRMEGHRMIGFVSSLTGRPLPLEFTVGKATVEVMLPSAILVGSADTSAAAARLGFGLIQAPRLRFADDLASGALVEVLAEHAPAPTPLSILYSAARQMPPRLRVFVDWVVSTVSPHLSPQNATSGSFGRQSAAAGAGEMPLPR